MFTPQHQIHSNGPFSSLVPSYSTQACNRRNAFTVLSGERLWH